MPRTMPSMATVNPGQYITAALWNANVKALGDLTTGPPVFVGYQMTAQSVPHGVWTSLTIDGVQLDSDGGHTTVNPSRYTATVPGTYLVIGTTGWSANSTGYRRCRIALDGYATLGGAVGTDVSQAVLSGQCTSAIVIMNGTTDFVEVQGMQSSGGPLATYNNSDFTCSLRILWISR